MITNTENTILENWRPTASLSALKIRAAILSKIRAFFAERNVLEVETPLLSHNTVTNPYIQSITAQYSSVNNKQKNDLYLQTSPEYAMKRLLAAGSGSIYQICKAFRNGEVGRKHNPEFTMLEWYQLDFDHHDLMSEMDELLQLVLKTPPATRTSYANIFKNYLKLNPHTVTVTELKNCAIKNEVSIPNGIDENDRDTWLELLMSLIIEPHLGHSEPIFIYDYPASQATLARIRHDDDPVAERFEVYIKGVELANGFHELADGKEQRKRFENNIIERRALGFNEIAIDENFIAALNHGLPNCAGVALGIDRLLMLAANANSISEIISIFRLTARKIKTIHHPLPCCNNFNLSCFNSMVSS